MDIQIHPMRAPDWPAVLQIYVEGMQTGLATFETEPPTWEHWNQGHLPAARLLAWCGDQLAGWVALSPVSARPCYAGVVEHSIYVSGAFRGQGVGRQLLLALFAETERLGIWTIQSSIFAENAASLALHRQVGFREVGRRERIAQRLGVWHDTILVERRSALV
jgi:phosphinothricin acetyltransferase